MQHAIYAPRPYGKMFADEPDKSVLLSLDTELLEEEKNTEFAKYFELGPCAPSAAAMDMLRPEKELDGCHAFMPEEYCRRMLHTGYNQFENGFCVMENGVAYVSLLTEQVGVNDGNMGYFNENFAPGEGDLFYKVWCPGKHIRLYPDLAIEDMGWGMAEVRITEFLTPDKLGITVDPTAVDPECIDIQAMNLEVVPLGALEGTEPLRLVEANYFRQNSKGREIRHRFWIGLSIENGKAVTYPVRDRDEAVKFALGTAFHSGSEFATLTRNITMFYNDRHPVERG